MSAAEDRELRATDRSGIAKFLGELVAEGMGILPDEPQWFSIHEGGEACGTVRIHERGGLSLIDDVWVMPTSRRAGIATSALFMALIWAGRHGPRDVWLLCDEDMVGFYERLDFVAADPSEFPRALAELCEKKGEWPDAGDHVHVPMRALAGEPA